MDYLELVTDSQVGNYDDIEFTGAHAGFLGQFSDDVARKVMDFVDESENEVVVTSNTFGDISIDARFANAAADVTDEIFDDTFDSDFELEERTCSIESILPDGLGKSAAPSSSKLCTHFSGNGAETDEELLANAQALFASDINIAEIWHMIQRVVGKRDDSLSMSLIPLIMGPSIMPSGPESLYGDLRYDNVDAKIEVLQDLYAVFLSEDEEKSFRSQSQAAKTKTKSALQSLLRAVSADGSAAEDRNECATKVHADTTAYLSALFAVKQKFKPEEMDYIGNMCHLSYSQVRTWFANKRARSKKKSGESGRQGEITSGRIHKTHK
ncbi:uncharacterized protein V1518DRAFT_405878 [Limtongia smithiae]|uniref:uncharacterized protein n=1 Tax=Limtongia smithiae TaxID=1125753 RepID=UPI0034CE5605